jgi:hypothetical protein
MASLAFAGQNMFPDLLINDAATNKRSYIKYLKKVF